MRDRITAIIAIVLLALLAGSTYWYSVSTRLGAIPSAVSREGPDVIGEKVTLTQFDAAGRAVNKLIGERITHYPSDDRAEVVQPRRVSLREDQPQIDARADRALVEESGARVTLTGNVTLVRAAGKDGGEKDEGCLHGAMVTTVWLITGAVAGQTSLASVADSAVT